jgi:hypothetical protein
VRPTSSSPASGCSCCAQSEIRVTVATITVKGLVIPPAHISDHILSILLTDNFVDDLHERRGGGDDDSGIRNVLFRLVQPCNEFPLRLLSAPLLFRSLFKPPVQGVPVNLKDKHAVKQIYEFRKVSGTAAEEGDRFILAGNQSFYFIYIPNVLVRDAIRPCTRFRIANPPFKIVYITKLSPARAAAYKPD